MKPDNKDKMKNYKNTSSFDAAASFLNSLAESADDINALLKSVAQYYDADRSYVFEITPDGKTVDNTYEWCREGVTAEIDNLQNVPIESVTLWINEFEKNGAFYISSLDSDVEKSSLTYEILEPQGIDSLITAPMYKNAVISGFIGVDNPRINTQDILVLKTAAGIIYGDIRRNIAESRESERATSVISSMVEDFDYICAINLDTGVITRYQASKKCHTVVDAIDINLPSNERMGIFLKTIVHPDYWEDFKKRTSPEAVSRELGINPVYKFDCLTVFYEGKEEWYRFKFSYMEDNPRVIVLGILNIDEQVRREQADAIAKQKEQLEVTSVLSAMAEDFDYIAAINQKDKTVTRYWKSDKFDMLDAIIDKNLPPYERLDSFFNLAVHPDDMQMFREKSDFKTAIAELEKYSSYKFDVRSLFNGKEEYYRVKFAYKPDNHDIVIMGLLNIDKQVRREMENAVLQEKAELDSQFHEQMGRVMELSENFQAIFDVDWETGKYDIFSYDTAYFEDVLVKMEKGKNFYADTLKDVEKVVYPEDRDLIRDTFSNKEYIGATLEAQGQFTIDYRLSGENGQPVWYRVKVVKKTGNDKHFLVGVFYVDERIRQEAENKKRIEQALSMAEAANAAKTTFLFNMSHDIRTPMNAITGFTNMAIKHIDDKEKVLDCLDKTHKAGQMLLSLINNVLEVSRIEAGRADIEEQPGDVYLSFTNINSTMQELAASKDINLSFNFLNIKDRYVYADFNRCMRIFVNIISNAIKYTPGGGDVKVTCEQAEDAKNGIGIYRYTFEDNGIGMSEEFQKHVFDQFSREQSSTVSGIQGTGLGMSVVKSFVDLLGGEITVKSRQGEGTTFTVLLPFKIQPGKTLTDPVTGEVIHADSSRADIRKDFFFEGKKILLVEDNEMNREIAEEILAENGFIVDTAEDGSIAYDMLLMAKPGDYDLILMDIQMPIMDGYTATKKIRALDSGIENIPIIALSANAFAEDRRKSFAAGMNDHVSKPINISELKETMAKYLQ